MMYPLESSAEVAEFHENGGTPLKAIKYRCRDCSGGSKVDVRACSYADCPLHPFRLGKNPNRMMSAEQRLIAAARLKKIRAKRRRTRRQAPESLPRKL